MKKLIVCFLVFAFLSFAFSAFAFDVTLTWDPNTESDLAGYEVYMGTATGVYNTPIKVGKDVTTYKFTGLVKGTKYYFNLKAFDNETPSLKSGFAGEIWTDGEKGLAPANPGGWKLIVVDISVNAK